MTTLARDLSKYSVIPTPGTLDRWQVDGLGLLIIQAHPSEYGQEKSLELMRVVAASGMPWDAYLYMYLAYPDWVPSALETLDLAVSEGLLPRKVWGDVEDIDSGKGWGPQQRAEAVQRDLTLIDQWAAGHGLPRAGVYGAKWYWDSYLGNTTAFSDRQNWTAQYDGVADASVFTPYGGWTSCRIKQFAGSQPDGTDLDVLSTEEEAELTNGGDPDVTDEERMQMQDKIDGLINSLGYIAGDVLRPLTRKTAPAYVKAAVAAIRDQAEQQGVAHA